MTPDPQSTPVNTPEQQGFLRRTADAMRGAMPTRGEAVAIGTSVMLAMGVGANVANAQKTETQKPVGPQPAVPGANAVSKAAWTPTPAEAEESCIDTALDSNPAVNFRYVRVKRNGKMVPGRKVRVNLNDPNNHTGIVGGSCAEYEIKPREFETWALRVSKNKKGKTSSANNSSTINTKLVDGKMIGGTVFYDKFTVNLKKRPGKGVKTHIKVRETVFPKNGPPQSRVSTYKKERIPYPKNDAPI